MVYGDLRSFENFLKLRGLSERTIKDYCFCLLRFNELFNQETVNKFLLKNQNTRDKAFLKIYQEYLLNNQEELKLTQDQINQILKVKFMSHKGRKKQRLIIPLSTEQINILIRYLPTEELKIMTLLCYKCGLRLQELLRIKISSFDWNKLKENPDSMGELRVLGKGNKEGIALVPNEVIKQIARYIKKKEFVNFDSKLFKMSEDTFQKKLKEAGLNSGLTRLNENKEPVKETIVHPHRLRHSYGTNLVKAGVPINTVKELMRHASISSTQIYLHLSKKDIENDIQNINF